MTVDTQTALTALGVILSVAFFLVGYRKTIGARRERLRTANREIVESLLKRLVLEEVLPDRYQLARFLAGKARDHSLRSREIIDLDEVIDSLHSQVIDNDFIGPDDRQRILTKLRDLRPPEKSPGPPSFMTVRPPPTREKRQLQTFVLALVSTGASVLVVAIALFASQVTKGESFPLEKLSPILVTVFAGLTVLVLASAPDLVRRLFDSEAERSDLGAKDLERLVYMAIRDKGVATLPTRGDSFDVMLETETGPFLVAVKRSLKRMSQRALRRLLYRLSSDADVAGVNAGIVVTLDFIPERLRAMAPENISLMHFRDFQAFLDKGKLPGADFG